jgi:hypothetical protein
LEVWVNDEKSKLDKRKQDFKDVFQNTIDIINNTNKNKDRIKQMLSKSKSRRPGIWSDYSDSFASAVLPPHGNMSLQNSKMQIFGSSNHSMNSFIFSGEKYKNNDDSINSSMIDIKAALKDRLMSLVKPKVNKEVEMKLPPQSPLNKLKLEIVNYKHPQETTGVGIETPDDKSNVNKQPFNIVDELNDKLEQSKESESDDVPYYQTLDSKIHDLESVKSSYSPETPKEKFYDDDKEKLDEEQNMSDEQKQIIIKAIKFSPPKLDPVQPNPIIKTDAIEEINVQSEWLETYLKGQKDDSPIEEIKVGHILYDNDDPELQTPE